MLEKITRREILKKSWPLIVGTGAVVVGIGVSLWYLTGEHKIGSDTPNFKGTVYANLGYGYISELNVAFFKPPVQPGRIERYETKDGRPYTITYEFNNRADIYTRPSRYIEKFDDSDKPEINVDVQDLPANLKLKINFEANAIWTAIQQKPIKDQKSGIHSLLDRLF